MSGTFITVGAGISTGAEPHDDPVEEAVRAEALGYDFVSASDHPVGTHATYDTFTLLTWIAARTSRIKVATRVLGVPFRRPAMVAKAAESVHRLSGGRLVLGLGGGHDDAEIRALGGPALTPGQKVEGMADAVTIIRNAWSGATYSHRGTVHATEDLTMTPRPTAPIPIWLGTYGPRALKVTGRLADGWIPSLGFAPPSRIPEMLDRIQTAAAEAGRAPVKAIYNVPVQIDGKTADDVVGGSPRVVLEQLLAFTELGFTGFNIVPVTSRDLRAFAEEVLPSLRQADRGN